AAAFDGVVAVVGRLLPGRELHAAVRAVGVIHADDAAERIVVDHRRHAHGDDVGIVFVLLGGREVGLVLLDGVSLVVDDRAAGADPAGIGGGVLDLAVD